MNRHTSKSVLADLPSTLPPVFFHIFFLSINPQLFKTKTLTQKQSFNYDLIVINYSFTLAMLITTLFAYSNSGAKAWWGIALFLNGLSGLVFSLYFALFSLLLGTHKKYTHFMSLFLLLSLAFLHFYPPYIELPIIGKISFIWLILFFFFFFFALFNLFYIFLYKRHTIAPQWINQAICTL